MRPRHWRVTRRRGWAFNCCPTGNHDISLDPKFHATHRQPFQGHRLEDPRHCQGIITGSDPSVILLQHQSAVIRLTRPEGPNTVFKVFGSPYSQFQGNWAFGYDTSDATALWDQIPLDTDIIVTHTPAQSYCDQKPTGKLVGCDVLRQRLSRVRPQLAVCGHVHEGWGYERVRWPSALINAGGEGDGVDGVDAVTRGVLPPTGSKKQCLIDLTGKRAARLDNEGFSCSIPAEHGISATGPMSPASVASGANKVQEPTGRYTSPDRAPSLGVDSHALGHALQTLRRETCIVNAAILATSWPHPGGKRFNGPIVVDLELPVWHSDHELG